MVECFRVLCLASEMPTSPPFDCGIGRWRRRSACCLLVCSHWRGGAGRRRALAEECTDLNPLPPQVQFSLWFLRYISTLSLFVLGIKAPGLPRKPYMLLINEDERDVEISEVSFFSSIQDKSCCGFFYFYLKRSASELVGPKCSSFQQLLKVTAISVLNTFTVNVSLLFPPPRHLPAIGCETEVPLRRWQ